MLIWVLRWLTAIVVVAGFCLIAFSLIYEQGHCYVNLCGPIRHWVPLA